ncbi:MAG: DUF4834 family protein [Bacteroides sp.]|nr:DUF4834 family protein [Bacteroides sp.]
MHIIAFILIIFVLLLFIGLSLIGSVIEFFLRLLGLGRKTTSRYSQQRTDSNQENHRNTESATSSRRNKIFDEDEGEYVDFEEVDD